jgi:hypothetical protein
MHLSPHVEYLYLLSIYAYILNHIMLVCKLNKKSSKLDRYNRWFFHCSFYFSLVRGHFPSQWITRSLAEIKTKIIRAMACRHITLSLIRIFFKVLFKSVKCWTFSFSFFYFLSLNNSRNKNKKSKFLTLRWIKNKIKRARKVEW